MVAGIILFAFAMETTLAHPGMELKLIPAFALCDTILSRFQTGGVRLKLVWYGFMLTAFLLAPLAVLLGQVLARDNLAVVPVMTTIGVLAALVQFLGLASWLSSGKRF